MIAWLLFRYLAVDADVRDGVWMRAVIDGAIRGAKTGRYDDFYSCLPYRDPVLIRQRWVEEVSARGKQLLFERDAEKFAESVNSSNDALWRSLESELDSLVGDVPLTAARASFHFHKAMAAINRKGDNLLAASMFAVARDEYAALCAEGSDQNLRAMFWQSAFHVPYALRQTAENNGYRQALMQLMCEAPVEVGAMPDQLRGRLAELLR
jgi:hypothetical protein